MKRVAVLDATFTIRNRIKELAARADIAVIETTTPKQLLNLLSAPNDIGLIITELDFPPEDGFVIFSEIKHHAGQIPVMILTAENHRSSFLKGIRLGAADYVLKPFDGEFLFKRIVDLMSSETAGHHVVTAETLGQGVPAMYVDFKSYVDKELKKASKGKFNVSIMVALIMDMESEMNSILERRCQRIANEVHHSLGMTLFDTDVLMKYGSRSFIGILPFCSPDDQDLVSIKMLKVFEKYRDKSDYESTLMLLTRFASYPEDGQDREELMAVAEERMAKAIRHMIPGNYTENNE